MAPRSSAAETLDEDDGPDDGTPLDRSGAVESLVDVPEGLTDRGGKGDRVVGGNLDLRGADGQSDRGTIFEIVDDDAPAGGQQQQQDERVGEHDASGGPVIEAGRGDGAETPTQQRSRKALQRQSRREGRDRTMGEVEHLRTELQTLKDQLNGTATRLGDFDRQNHERTVAYLNGKIEASTNAAVAARRQMVEASTNGDHEGMAAALDARDKALQEATKLTAQRNLMVSGNVFDDRLPADGIPAAAKRTAPAREAAPRQEQRQPQVTIAPAVRENVDDFVAEFPWYHPEDPNNAASQAVLAIDRSVAKDGYDPAGSEYWDEMRARMREELPQRYFAADGGGRQPARAANGADREQQPRRPAAQPQRRGPSMAGPADSGAGQNRQKVALTKGSKDSLVEMGVIASDGRTVVDRPRFMRMLKQYSEVDAANGGSRQ